ncbi:MAG: hypothetical protein NVS3B5_21190 [Sphingomicrobium sp.]
MPMLIVAHPSIALNLTAVQILPLLASLILLGASPHFGKRSVTKPLLAPVKNEEPYYARLRVLSHTSTPRTRNYRRRDWDGGLSLA